MATVEIQPDDLETRYDDTNNTTGFGFVTFFNSASSTASPFSDAMPYAGRDEKSQAEMVKRIRGNLEEKTDEFIKDPEIEDKINDFQRDILNERMWTFNEIERSTSRVANQHEYDIDDEIKTLHTIRVDTQPLIKVPQSKWEMLHWDTDQDSDTQSHCGIFGEKIKLYPRPASSASSTALDGDINASVTTITVDSTASFNRGDYFRFKIDDEIIYATGSTATTFTGCKRAQEGTTAATHSNDATVTELDIVMTGQKEAVDLDSQNDTTIIPEPKIITDGVTAELAHTKLKDHSIGDRFDIKYEKRMKSFREKYSKKLTSQFNRVKQPFEVIQGNKFRNPNNYPQDVTAV